MSVIDKKCHSPDRTPGKGVGGGVEREAVKKLANQLAERMVGGFRAHEFSGADSCDACGMSGMEAAQLGIGCPGRVSLAWLYDLPRAAK